MRNLLLLLFTLAVFLSCNKTEIERFDDFTSLDYTDASDQLGVLTYGGYVIRNQSDFDTLMAYSGDTMTFPGLQTNQLMLVFSQKVDSGNETWVEFYSKQDKDQPKRYEFNFWSEKKPDYLNGEWVTKAVIVDVEDVNADISFYEYYRGN